MTPEEKARETIDALLTAAGWIVQDRAEANIDAGRGVAIREFSLGRGYGEADSRTRIGVLQQAFNGQLVSQDPTDEPASALLERIRGERATSARQPKRRGRKASITAVKQYK